jgi:hypothetical protein
MMAIRLRRLIVCNLVAHDTDGGETLAEGDEPSPPRFIYSGLVHFAYRIKYYRT